MTLNVYLHVHTVGPGIDVLSPQSTETLLAVVLVISVRWIPMSARTDGDGGCSNAANIVHHRRSTGPTFPRSAQRRKRTVVCLDNFSLLLEECRRRINKAARRRNPRKKDAHVLFLHVARVNKRASSSRSHLARAGAPHLQNAWW